MYQTRDSGIMEREGKREGKSGDASFFIAYCSGLVAFYKRADDMRVKLMADEEAAWRDGRNPFTAF